MTPSFGKAPVSGLGARLLALALWAALGLNTALAVSTWSGASSLNLNDAGNWDTLPGSANGWVFNATGALGSTLNNDLATNLNVTGISFNAGTATTTSASASSGASTLTLTSVAGLSIGSSIAGTGISANTTVTGIAGSVVTLSQATTASIANGASLGYNGGAFTLAGNAINLGSNIVINPGGGNQVINLDMVLTGNRSFTTNSSILTLNGVISGGFNAVFNAANGGTINLAPNNTYSGATTIQNSRSGITNVTSLNSVATNAGLGTVHASSSNLGAPTSVANGTINIGAAQQTDGILRYIGSGETTDRVINLASATGGAVLDQSGTGLLKFTSGFTATGGGVKTLTLQGSTAGTGEIAGAIVDNVSNLTTLTVATTTTPVSTLTLGSVNGVNVGATITGTGIAGGTTITGIAGNVVTLSQPTNSTAMTTATAITVVGASIKNPTSLTKSGTGTWTLSGANTYTGATTVTGTLKVTSLANGGGASSLGASSNVASNLTITNGSTLSYIGSGDSTDRLLQTNTAGSGTSMTLDASGTGAINFTSTGAVGWGTTNQLRSFILDGTSTAANTLALQLNDNGTGATAVTKNGTGTWALSGANTYTGGTALNGGILQLANAIGLGTTGTISFGGGFLHYGSGITTDLSARFSSAAAQAFALDTNGNTVTFAIGLSSTGGTLTKTGTGTLTLNAANTYTGATTVSGGTLTLNASGGALSQTSGVTIGSGGTVALGAANQIKNTANLNLNGGTLALNGFDQTLGALDLNANSTLELSGSAHLVFADSSALDWNSATLSVVNFSATTNTLRFGTAATGLTGTQLGLFRFVEFGNSAARIDADGFLAPLSLDYLNSGGTDIVISTAITGTTSVDQTGSASTTLTGANTSTGLATVSAGTLVIGTAAGGNWAGNVSVSGTGILKGRGTISGAVVVNSAGNYSPGNSPAIQNVGLLTVNTGGLVTIELDGVTAGNGAGFHDQIASVGAVTLNGGTLSAATIFAGSSSPAYTPSFGASHTIITGSAITGSFAAYDFVVASNPSGMSWLPEYTATAVNLYAVPDNYGAFAGLTVSQTRLGVALQSLRPAQIDNRAAPTATRTLFNRLMRLDLVGLRTAYDQLSPEKLTALAAVTFQSSSLLNSSLLTRSAELRRVGPASASLNGVAVPASSEEFTMETVIEDGVHYQIAKAKPKKRVGYFAGASGAFAAVDGSANRLGSFSQTGAGYGGFDYTVNENQSLGLVVSQALTDTDFAGASGSARTTTSRVGVFHDYHNNGFYLNSSASVGFSSYDSKRQIAFLNQTASGETQGLSYGGQLGTGYDFKVGNYIIGPTASLAYDHARIDGFGETGSAADLQVGRQNADSLVTALGGRVSRPFTWQRLGWIPEVSLGVSRQHFNPNVITARFVAGGDAFKVQPQDGGGEFINPGASLTVVGGRDWSVRLGYSAILSPDSAAHRVEMSVNAGF